MLNFEMGEIDFGFGASDQTDRGSFGCQTDGETFSDTATGSSDENAFSLQVKAHSEGIIMPMAGEALFESGFSPAFDGVHGFVSATEESGRILAVAMFYDANGGPDGDGEGATVEGDFVAAFETLEDLSSPAEGPVQGAV